MQDVKVLVTGGAGFIGSHLCELLLAKGCQVRVLDNFNDFYDPAIKRGNVKEMYNYMQKKGIASGKLAVIEGDICDQQVVEKVFTSSQPDLVVHLAAMAGVRPSIARPQLYYRVNMDGTLNLLEACKQHGVSKFVFASSSSVYGNNEKVPFSETDFVDNPISPYAATKKAGELLCHTYHSLYGLTVVCLRFFTVYGPRQRPDLAIHKFARLMDANEALPFFGDGSTERDYTFIDDIVAGVYNSMLWMDKNPGSYEVFNLGESRTISLSQMVATLEAAMGSKAKLERLPLQPGDVSRTYADISKAKKILGYNPCTDFSRGMEIFIQWFHNNSRGGGRGGI